MKVFVVLLSTQLSNHRCWDVRAGCSSVVTRWTVCESYRPRIVRNLSIEWWIPQGLEAGYLCYRSLTSHSLLPSFVYSCNRVCKV